MERSFVWFHLVQTKIYLKSEHQEHSSWPGLAVVLLTMSLSLFALNFAHAANHLGCQSAVILLLLSNENGTGPGTTCDDDDVTNDIPFSYTLTPNHISINTPGGILKTFIGPWGAHAPPHTGHNDGDKKANWSGLFVTRYDELTELAGNGNGICEKGEVCGLPSSEIDNRIPAYMAPDDNLKIWSVRVESVISVGDIYYGSTLKWIIDSSLCRFGYRFNHVGEISKDLRDKLVAAGYVDPWTMTGRTGNLITGEPIVMKKGEAIGFPQIIAQEVPGYRGYYIGGGTFPQTPWAQIEFTNQKSKDVSEPFYFNDFYPLYGWLPTGTQEALRDILYADANNPESFRYEFDGLIDWLWKAEMDLWTVNGFIYDYSSIFSRLGSWWEDGPVGCSPGTIFCDEVFSIFPIIKTSPFYSPAMYDSADVSYLVHRWQADNVMGPGYKQHWEWGEVIHPSAPDGVSGSIIIKWRIDHEVVTPTYQAASYRVFPGDRQLKIRWSDRVPNRSSVTVPPIPASFDMCDGVKITCHSSEWWPW